MGTPSSAAPMPAAPRRSRRRERSPARRSPGRSGGPCMSGWQGDEKVHTRGTRPVEATPTGSRHGPVYRPGQRTRRARPSPVRPVDDHGTDLQDTVRAARVAAGFDPGSGGGRGVHLVRHARCVRWAGCPKRSTSCRLAPTAHPPRRRAVRSWPGCTTPPVSPLPPRSVPQGHHRNPQWPPTTSSYCPTASVSITTAVRRGAPADAVLASRGGDKRSIPSTTDFATLATRHPAA